jgi:chemosensory pili system protein ChpC
MSLPPQVPSLIIPLEGGSLLVPNSCVAEIINYDNVESVADAVDWQIANVKWRETILPCISFEKLSGRSRQAYPKDRIAIFNTVTDSFEKRFYALVVRGIPRLIRVTQEDIVEEEIELSQYEKLRVLVNGEATVIPDLESIEKSLAEKAI